LRSALRRPGDLVARYGGEEFCVVLPDISVADAAQVGESLRAAIETLALEHAAVPPGVISISVGVAAARPGGSMAADALLRAADDALYRAKSAGRNNVVTQK
ncbi:MAG TPA: diguanylate cyclase, partial [Telluria sp.]